MLEQLRPSQNDHTLLSPRIPRDTEHERYHPELEEELKECLFCLKRNEMMFDLEVDTANQVGMKNNAVNGRTDFIFRSFDTCRLTGTETYNSAFLIIIILSSIFNVTTFGFFQEECVKTIIHLDMVDRFSRFGQVNDTDQRVQCLKSV